MESSDKKPLFFIFPTFFNMLKYQQLRYFLIASFMPESHSPSSAWSNAVPPVYIYRSLTTGLVQQTVQIVVRSSHNLTLFVGQSYVGNH